MKQQARVQSLAVGAAVFAAIVVPVAAAGAQAPKKSGAMAKAVAKQIKAVKALTVALDTEVAGLRTRVQALEAGGSGNAGGGQASGAVPIGPAGGDLAGNYPDPQLRSGAIASGDIADGSILGGDIAPGAITGAQIAPASIGSTEIADHAIGSAQLAPFNMGALQLGTIKVVQSPFNFIGANAEGTVEASCPPGSRMLSGGASWAQPGAGFSLAYSAPLNQSTWVARGRNSNSNGPERFSVSLLCLEP